ncbi:MAG: hypothetical protein KY443_05100 [Actinobacteria bacterium]|nr:hypothetical protein [Actinomycetota bacterium]
MQQPWETRHSPYTVEGKIEGFGRLADGINQRRKRRRGGRSAGMQAVVYLLLASLVAGVLATLITLFFKLS